MCKYKDLCQIVLLELIETTKHNSVGIWILLQHYNVENRNVKETEENLMCKDLKLFEGYIICDDDYRPV
jgi:hypothetical protein